MRSKRAVLWLSFVIAVNALVISDMITEFTPTVRGNTLYVNETGSGGVYTNIQDAIDGASAGDTVFVHNGTYIGNVVINKTINLTGEDREYTIIKGDGSGVVVNVTADWVNISGFTIIGLGPSDYGIELNDAQNCNITDVKVVVNISLSINYTMYNITSSGEETIFFNFDSIPGYYYTDVIYNDTNNATYFVVISENHTTELGPYYNVTIAGNGTFHVDVEDITYYDIPNVTFNITHFNIVDVNITTGPDFTINLTYITPINWTYTTLINTTYEASIINITSLFYWTVPSMPTNLTATAGDSYVNLTWSPQSLGVSSWLVNYTIYRGTAPGQETFLIELGNVLYYNDTNVTNGVTYFYKVSAVNLLGESPLSNETKATPTASLGPSKQSLAKFGEIPWWLWIIINIIVAFILVGIVINYARYKDKMKQR